MVTQACNPCTRMGEARGSRAQDHPQLHFKVEYSLGSGTMSQKKKKKEPARWFALPPNPCPELALWDPHCGREKTPKGCLLNYTCGPWHPDIYTK